MVSIGFAWNVFRDRASVALVAVSIFFFVTVLASIAGADELPLVLSNENIGMSGSDIEATQGAVPKPAPIVLEMSSKTTGAEAVESDAVQPESEFVSSESAAASPPCTASDARAPGITEFGQCVEAAIRGGIGFEESSRVCRALFSDEG